MSLYFDNALGAARQICMKSLKIGDIAVDATMGNGNDTVLLASIVGSSGKVYSFDIQSQALYNTREVLIKNNLERHVQLILDGHENMDHYIHENVKLVIFNLGYLPKGDHSITTKAATTIIAIEKSLGLLHKDGKIVIVIYHGHEEGKVEKNEVEKFVAHIDQKQYSVFRLEYMNQVNNPPILICIEKR